MDDSESRRTVAIRLMIDDLEEMTRRQAELADRLEEVKRERDVLLGSIQPMVRSLEGEARREFWNRLDRVAGLIAPPALQVGRSPTARAALAFLAETEHTEIRAAELTYYLRRKGFAVRSRYGARLLDDWRRRGLVERVGHGVYRLVMGHPEVVRVRLDLLKNIL